MVHLRLNEKETNPNPHINFTTALPAQDLESHEDARQLLRALAAQVRPVMKSHGFTVNSLEEYEHNKVFAGRNWNNGEVVELVLRGASGYFLPVSWLMSTFCHELAHIKHMNHGPAFQTLWTQLRNEVRNLQSKGYYGDGYWSSGIRLADSARVGGQDIEAGDVPEYMCGGAQTRVRPATLRRRRKRQVAGPSTHTGAQTAKKRKAGGRVTAQGTFTGTGTALNADVVDESKKKVGLGFRRKASSMRAKEERALAAERRILTLQNAGSTQGSDAEDDGDEAGSIQESDLDRRRTMDEMEHTNLDALKVSRTDFSRDFMFPERSRTTPSLLASSEVVLRDSSEPLALPCDMQVTSLSGTGVSSGSASGSNAHNVPGSQTSSSNGLVPQRGDKATRESNGIATTSTLDEWVTASPPKKQKVSYGDMVQGEVNLRKKETLLGLTGGGRTLGSAPATITAGVSALVPTQARGSEHDRVQQGQEQEHAWDCLVCTLSNSAMHLACAVCETPRGDLIWTGAR